MYRIKQRAGTPLSMDQFGWNSDEVVLKYGSIMAGIGILAFIGFFTVGPLSQRWKLFFLILNKCLLNTLIAFKKISSFSKEIFGSQPHTFIFRFDERILILVGGVLSMILAIVFFMPLPGNENKHICNEIQSGLRYQQISEIYQANSSLFRFLSPLGGLSERVSCEDSQDIGCCALDWCKEQSALNVPQFVIAFCIFAAGHPFRVSITQALFTKILGPVPQVRVYRIGNRTNISIFLVNLLSVSDLLDRFCSTLLNCGLKFQGIWLGVMSAAGSLARCVGPFLVGWIYNDYGIYWTFACSLISGVLALALLLLSYKRLIPFERRKNEENNDEYEIEVTKL